MPDARLWRFTARCWSRASDRRIVTVTSPPAVVRRFHVGTSDRCQNIEDILQSLLAAAFAVESGMHSQSMTGTNTNSGGGNGASSDELQQQHLDVGAVILSIGGEDWLRYMSVWRLEYEVKNIFLGARKMHFEALCNRLMGKQIGGNLWSGNNNN